MMLTSKTFAVWRSDSGHGGTSAAISPVSYVKKVGEAPVITGRRYTFLSILSRLLPVPG